MDNIPITTQVSQYSPSILSDYLQANISNTNNLNYEIEQVIQPQSSCVTSEFKLWHIHRLRIKDYGKRMYPIYNDGEKFFENLVHKAYLDLKSYLDQQVLFQNFDSNSSTSLHLETLYFNFGLSYMIKNLNYLEVLYTNEYIPDELFIHPKNSLLHDNQKNLIYRLKQTEKINSGYGPHIFGIGEYTGAGKTTSMLSLCHSGDLYDTSLIVVSHKLIHQWKNENAQFFDEKNVILLEKKSEIVKLFLKISTSLVSNSQEYIYNYRPFNDLYKFDNVPINIIILPKTLLSFFKLRERTIKIFFKRLIIDEIETIKFMFKCRDRLVNAKYIYLLSANILSEAKSLTNVTINKIFMHELSSFTIFKEMSRYNYTEKIFHNDLFSLKLNFSYQHMLHLANDDYDKNYLMIINEVLKKENEEILKCSEKINKTVQEYNNLANVNSLDNSFIEKIITHPPNLKLNQKAKNLIETYSTLKKKRNDLNENVKYISDRILQGTCVVCYEKKSSHILTTCCSHIICLECGSEWNKLNIESNKQNCLYCKSNNVKYIILTNTAKCLDKTARFESFVSKIYSSNRIHKVLVYTTAAQIFCDKLDYLSIPNWILKGSRKRVGNLLKKFQNLQKTSFMFIDNYDDAAGHNMQFLTDIWIGNDLPESVEAQLISRGQRFGRDKNNILNVEKVVYSHEKKIVKHDEKAVQRHFCYKKDVDYDKLFELWSKYMFKPTEYLVL